MKLRSPIAGPAQAAGARRRGKRTAAAGSIAGNGTPAAPRPEHMRGERREDWAKRADQTNVEVRVEIFRPPKLAGAGRF